MRKILIGVVSIFVLSNFVFALPPGDGTWPLSKAIKLKGVTAEGKNIQIELSDFRTETTTNTLGNPHTVSMDGFLKINGYKYQISEGDFAKLGTENKIYIITEPRLTKEVTGYPSLKTLRLMGVEMTKLVNGYKVVIYNNVKFPHYSFPNPDSTEVIIMK